MALKWVPVGVIQEVLTTRRVNAFKIYLVIHASNHAYAKDNILFRRHLAKECGLDIKTINKHLDNLLKWDWLGYCDKNKVFYVRSIWTINMRISGSNFMAVEFHYDYCNDFKAYLVGAFIGYLAYAQRRKIIAKAHKAQELKRVSSYQRAGALAYFPVALKGIAKILNCSSKTAHAFKMKAVKFGAIGVRKKYQEAHVSYDYIKFLRMKFDSCPYKVAKGKKVRQLIDEVSPYLSYSNKKKRYTYKRV